MIDGDALLADLDTWEQGYWGGPRNESQKKLAKKAKDKRYYERHKAELSEKNAAYIRSHPEQRKLTCKRYYQNNVEKEAARQKKYLEENQEKYQSHLAVQRAKRDGILKPEPCESCGSEKASAHHDDYTKPLEVRWLCHKCHMAWHSKLRKENA